MGGSASKGLGQMVADTLTLGFIHDDLYADEIKEGKKAEAAQLHAAGEQVAARMQLYRTYYVVVLDQWSEDFRDLLDKHPDKVVLLGMPPSGYENAVIFMIGTKSKEADTLFFALVPISRVDQMSDQPLKPNKKGMYIDPRYDIKDKKILAAGADVEKVFKAEYELENEQAWEQARAKVRPGLWRTTIQPVIDQVQKMTGTNDALPLVMGGLGVGIIGLSLVLR